MSSLLDNFARFVKISYFCVFFDLEGGNFLTFLSISSEICKFHMRNDYSSLATRLKTHELGILFNSGLFKSFKGGIH